MITPARKTPAVQARTVFLKGASRRLAASVPVHAPVPGKGMPTNSVKAIKKPLLFALSFSPAAAPRTRKKRHTPPIKRRSFPHSKNLRAKRYMIGTGIMFPITHTIYDVNNGNGGLNAWETGIAPRSSMSGTIEIIKI